ncbi:MAG: hypothetical protein HYV15_06445, partial [Elusimicrobia bacterium]|nr:hypothetical protein [Elusimicrobiota bacterium]
MTGTGIDDNLPLVFTNGFLYMVGAASGATTVGMDAGVWKFDPNAMTFVSSRTLDSGLLSDDIVMAATSTALGDLMLTGAVGTGVESYVTALWHYATASDALVFVTSANAPGSSFDFASGIASTGTSTFWLIGMSSQPVGGGPNVVDLALWKYVGGSSLELMNTLPAFMPNSEGNPEL